MNEHNLSRRSFLGYLFAGAGSVAGFQVLAGCATIPKVPRTIEGGRAAIGLNEFRQFAGGRHGVMITANELADPILLIETSEGKFIALSARCTHQGCLVRPGRGSIQCPCHGSTFGFSGAVLRGPAREPLPSYEVEVTNEMLEIVVY